MGILPFSSNLVLFGLAEPGLNSALPMPTAAPNHRPRFALDASAGVLSMPPGVARVSREICARLAKSERIEALALAPEQGQNQRMWRHLALPRLARDCDGIIAFTSAFPLAGRGKRVQVIHELPWMHGESENAGLVHRLWARNSFRRADRVIVPSEGVLADLERFTPAVAARARVIRWGVEPGFDGAQVDLGKLGIGPGPFVLMAGATRPKKRVAAALRGLALMGAGAPSLVVTGELTSQCNLDLRLARELGLEGKLQILGRVGEHELRGLTARAAAALGLARSEGFGFGTLEAMAAGTAVVVTAGSVLADLAADAGFAVDPDQPEQLAAALGRILGGQAGDQIAAGLVRSAEFTWDRAATAFEDLALELA